MISETKKYLEDGNNLGRFSNSKDTRYVSDSEDFRPAFRNFQANQSIIIESSSKDLNDLKSIKKWARSTFLKVLAHATSVTSPEQSNINIWRCIDSHIAPIINDDNSTTRVQALIQYKPVTAICMAPIYPLYHPRYAPNTILVLVWFWEIENYDALELVLPLPPETLAN